MPVLGQKSNRLRELIRKDNCWHQCFVSFAVEPIVAEISPARIEATIRKLASFGTRHTPSDPDIPNRGIGAARRWIKAELESYAKESGGRLIVEKDSFVQPVAPRVPRPTTLVNLVAILPGALPASKDRWLVVSGHYDSVREFSEADSLNQAKPDDQYQFFFSDGYHRFEMIGDRQVQTC